MTGFVSTALCALIVMIWGFGGVTAHAFSTSGCEGDCTKCHALSSQEANEILKKNDLFKKLNIPDAKILGVKLSPVKSLWEVSLDSKGRNAVLYIDYSKKHVVLGSILEVATLTNKTAEQMKKLEESRRIEVSKISLDHALIMGKTGAAKKVIVFTDPDCPHCAKLHEELKKVVETRQDIAVYLKLYPLKAHKDAYWKSKSIICKKSLQMLDEVFQKKSIPKPECATKEVDNTIKLAESLGISGTPTIIFSDGRIRSGSMSAETLIALVDGK